MTAPNSNRGSSDHGPGHSGLDAFAEDATATVLRLEEDADVHAVEGPSGTVRVRKRVDTYPLIHRLPRDSEDVTVEYEGAEEQDSGQIETLPDGSVSIPVFEEEIVITRRTVVRERIIVRKKRVTEEQEVSVELRRERVEVTEAQD